MPHHTTKNDLYAELIQLASEKDYVAIPEFRVNVPKRLVGGRWTTGKKDIDLVWARRLAPERQAKPWQEHWELIATFEIEACDVRNISGKEFNRHILDLPSLKNHRKDAPIKHFIALYTAAFDRNWNANRPVDQDIDERIKWAAGSVIEVIDGRSLDSLRAL